jgi:hypothetical protein
MNGIKLRVEESEDARFPCLALIYSALLQVLSYFFFSRFFLSHLFLTLNICFRFLQILKKDESEHFRLQILHTFHHSSFPESPVPSPSISPSSSSPSDSGTSSWTTQSSPAFLADSEAPLDPDTITSTRLVGPLSLDDDEDKVDVISCLHF